MLPQYTSLFDDVIKGAMEKLIIIRTFIIYKDRMHVYGHLYRALHEPHEADNSYLEGYWRAFREESI